jgi:imidazolonepropionase-like amidohydrolase
MALLVEGDRIADIGPRDAFATDPVGLEIVDLGGRFVAPGFVDPQVHVALDASLHAIDNVDRADEPRTWALAARNAATSVAAGVTTMADCGGPGHLVLRLRDAVAAAK